MTLSGAVLSAQSGREPLTITLPSLTLRPTPPVRPFAVQVARAQCCRAFACRFEFVRSLAVSEICQAEREESLWDGPRGQDWREAADWQTPQQTLQ